MAGRGEPTEGKEVRCRVTVTGCVFGSSRCIGESGSDCEVSRVSWTFRPLYKTSGNSEMSWRIRSVLDVSGVHIRQSYGEFKRASETPVQCLESL